MHLANSPLPLRLDGLLAQGSTKTSCSTLRSQSLCLWVLQQSESHLCARTQPCRHGPQSDRWKCPVYTFPFSNNRSEEVHNTATLTLIKCPRPPKALGLAKSLPVDQLCSSTTSVRWLPKVHGKLNHKTSWLRCKKQLHIDTYTESSKSSWTICTLAFKCWYFFF